MILEAGLENMSYLREACSPLALLCQSKSISPVLRMMLKAGACLLFKVIQC